MLNKKNPAERRDSSVRSKVLSNIQTLKMTPRIFVSSTYYDLKHVRERLELFLNNYGFEAVLFESEKVTYQFDKEIDSSAYQEVSMCHVMVLIVGGRYGSMSTVENGGEDQRKYEDYFISITRKEYETAISKKIPVLIFVEKNVFGEYLTYSENKIFFDSINDETTISKASFKFAHVDHVNIFKFIDFFKNKPIKTFERVEEIESYIKFQFSGMFYLYLESLKQKSETNKILDTVGELNNVTLRMNEMMNSVGKKILGNGNEEYEAVIQNQYAILLEFFFDKFDRTLYFIECLTDKEIEEVNFGQVALLFYESLFTNKIKEPSLKKNLGWTEFKKQRDNVVTNFITELNKKLYHLNPNMQIEKLDVFEVNRLFKMKVEPFIKTQENKNLFEKKLEDFLKGKLMLPF